MNAKYSLDPEPRESTVYFDIKEQVFRDSGGVVVATLLDMNDKNKVWLAVKDRVAMDDDHPGGFADPPAKVLGRWADDGGQNLEGSTLPSRVRPDGLAQREVRLDCNLNGNLFRLPVRDLHVYYQDGHRSTVSLTAHRIKRVLVIPGHMDPMRVVKTMGFPADEPFVLIPTEYWTTNAHRIPVPDKHKPEDFIKVVTVGQAAVDILGTSTKGRPDVRPPGQTGPFRGEPYQDQSTLTRELTSDLGDQINEAFPDEPEPSSIVQDVEGEVPPMDLPSLPPFDPTGGNGRNNLLWVVALRDTLGEIGLYGPYNDREEASRVVAGSDGRGFLKRLIQPSDDDAKKFKAEAEDYIPAYGCHGRGVWVAWVRLNPNDTYDYSFAGPYPSDEDALEHAIKAYEWKTASIEQLIPPKPPEERPDAEDEGKLSTIQQEDRERFEMQGGHDPVPASAPRALAPEAFSGVDDYVRETPADIDCDDPQYHPGPIGRARCFFHKYTAAGVQIDAMRCDGLGVGEMQLITSAVQAALQSCTPTPSFTAAAWGHAMTIVNALNNLDYKAEDLMIGEIREVDNPYAAMGQSLVADMVEAFGPDPKDLLRELEAGRETRITFRQPETGPAQFNPKFAEKLRAEGHDPGPPRQVRSAWEATKPMRDAEDALYALSQPQPPPTVPQTGLAGSLNWLLSFVGQMTTAQMAEAIVGYAATGNVVYDLETVQVALERCKAECWAELARASRPARTEPPTIDPFKENLGYLERTQLIPILADMIREIASELDERNKVFITDRAVKEHKDDVVGEFNAKMEAATQEYAKAIEHLNLDKRFLELLQEHVDSMHEIGQDDEYKEGVIQSVTTRVINSLEGRNVAERGIARDVFDEILRVARSAVGNEIKDQNETILKANENLQRSVTYYQGKFETMERALVQIEERLSNDQIGWKSKQLEELEVRVRGQIDKQFRILETMASQRQELLPHLVRVEVDKAIPLFVGSVQTYLDRRLPPRPSSPLTAATTSANPVDLNRGHGTAY